MLLFELLSGGEAAEKNAVANGGEVGGALLQLTGTNGEEVVCG
jgi:hypothetical protein